MGIVFMTVKATVVAGEMDFMMDPAIIVIGVKVITMHGEISAHGETAFMMCMEILYTPMDDSLRRLNV